MRKQRHRWRWGNTFGTTCVRADCSPGALSVEHIQKWSGTQQRGWKWKCTPLLLSTSEGHFSPLHSLHGTVLLPAKTEWDAMSCVLSNYGSTLLNFPSSLKESRQKEHWFSNSISPNCSHPRAGQVKWRTEEPAHRLSDRSCACPWIGLVLANELLPAPLCIACTDSPVHLQIFNVMSWCGSLKFMKKKISAQKESYWYFFRVYFYSLIFCWLLWFSYFCPLNPTWLLFFWQTRSKEQSPSGTSARCLQVCTSAWLLMPSEPAPVFWISRLSPVSM